MPSRWDRSLRGDSNEYTEPCVARHLLAHTAAAACRVLVSLIYMWLRSGVQSPVLPWKPHKKR
eukprot:1220241-Ditylum_brightwellii.AAC.1